MLLGVAYHATYAWLPEVGRWYFVADGAVAPGLTFVTGFLHAWRMQLFFALAGFFAHLVFERRGARAFLKERTRRLLWPFAVALPLVVLSDWGVRATSHAWGLMHPDYAPGAALRFKPVHLWFLLYLWSFCACAWLLPAWAAPARWVQRALRFAPSLLVLALPTCAGLWLHPENRPDAAFWPRPFEALHYGLFFAFGWWLWVARAEAASLRRWAPAMGAAAAALSLWLFTGNTQWQPHGQVLTGLLAWLVTLGGFGWALTATWSVPPLLVASSYWVYLVHYPLVLTLQLLFARVPWPAWLEYLLTVALALGVALGAFVAVVRGRRWAVALGLG